MTEIINNPIRKPVTVVFNSDICRIRVNDEVHSRQEDGGSCAVSVAAKMISGIVRKCEVTANGLAICKTTQDSAGIIRDIGDYSKEGRLGNLA